MLCSSIPAIHFNPQGSHEPRPTRVNRPRASNLFQSTRLSRASTRTPDTGLVGRVVFQSTRLSRASTEVVFADTGQFFISIHKALTSLDTVNALKGSLQSHFNPQGSHEPRQQKYTIILASMPNLYILIIHLQQIIQQVKKFSRILILFSGRLQCESPWNFMCNYYSHQSFLTKNQPSFKLPPLSICAKFSRTILNNHLKWRSQLTVYPAVYYVLSRSKNSNVFT